MSIPTATASPWPARAAHISAAIFIAASGTVNLLYGISKGSDPVSSAVWGAVSVAASITFALSIPALTKARSLSAAMVAIVALLFSGGYSISAALGSAGAGRMDAAAQEKDNTGARQRAQSSYDTAKAELASLRPTRAVGELLAMREGWLRNCKGCGPWVLEPELARAKRRSELEQALAAASGQLAATRTARVANADSKVLARYLAALGADIGPERLNDLLVLLTVALVEMGAGLSLALGLALSVAPGGQDRAPSDSHRPDNGGRPGVRDAPDAGVRPTRPTPRFTVRPPDDASDNAIVVWLRGHGGRIVGVRRLADAIGRPRSTVSDQLRRLASQGRVSLTPGRRGLDIELAPAARPN